MQTDSSYDSAIHLLWHDPPHDVPRRTCTACMVCLLCHYIVSLRAQRASRLELLPARVFRGYIPSRSWKAGLLSGATSIVQFAITSLFQPFFSNTFKIGSALLKKFSSILSKPARSSLRFLLSAISACFFFNKPCLSCSSFSRSECSCAIRATVKSFSFSGRRSGESWS